MAVETPAVNMDKLMAFLGQVIGELGATVNAGLIVIGDRLGLYKAMAGAGPITSTELAEKTRTSERYIREWLNAQAAGGFVTYDPATKRYELPPEQAMALADEDNEHDAGVPTGCERFFRPGYNANLVSAWLPALDGVEEKLRVGATVADVGCGLGASSRLMADAYPRSHVTGFDYHQESIELARQKARAAGLSDRLKFEVAPAQSFPGNGYDLVTMFDCLHDMGDPVGAARHVRQALAKDGTWLIVEPIAGDTVESNLNPVGRAYYSFSTYLCTPSSLSQEVGLALGAQAGPKRIHDVVTAAGFTRFRKVAETPFNLVYEARP
ncbi:MAG: class I SAM-dependent methyltransferase [Chloroflexi bacterium]|nr:MAG: class I SAM-dependent methyltransferase [Chloroflexota bacterium]